MNSRLASRAAFKLHQSKPQVTPSMCLLGMGASTKVQSALRMRSWACVFADRKLLIPESSGNAFSLSRTMFPRKPCRASVSVWKLFFHQNTKGRINRCVGVIPSATGARATETIPSFPRLASAKPILDLSQFVRPWSH